MSQMAMAMLWWGVMCRAAMDPWAPVAGPKVADSDGDAGAIPTGQTRDRAGTDE